MTQRVVCIVGIVTLFATTAFGSAASDLPRWTPERPYIVEVGEPYAITSTRLDREAARNSALEEQLTDYGYPEYVEIQEITPQWPWETYELRLYYLQRNVETDFGHVIVSPAMPNFGLLKYQAEITPEKRHQIEVILAARQSPPIQPVIASAPPPAAAATTSEGGSLEDAVARIEAAAARAEEAANRAVEQSEAAVRAADRTNNMVEKMSASMAPSTPPRRVRKRH